MKSHNACRACTASARRVSRAGVAAGVRMGGVEAAQRRERRLQCAPEVAEGARHFLREFMFKQRGQCPLWGVVDRRSGRTKGHGRQELAGNGADGKQEHKPIEQKCSDSDRTNFPSFFRSGEYLNDLKLHKNKFIRGRGHGRLDGHSRAISRQVRGGLIGHRRQSPQFAQLSTHAAAILLAMVKTYPSTFSAGRGYV